MDKSIIKMMKKVTPPKTEYEQLVKNFRDANLYSEEFLQDLESGLCKSSYIKNIKRYIDN